MVPRKLSLYLFVVQIFVTNVMNDRAWAQDPLHSSDVIISDYGGYHEPDYYAQYDQAVTPMQFQQGANARTAARPASIAGTGQRTPQAFTVRLARAPNMMGDFFNVQGQTGVVGELFTDGGAHEGLAVHQSSTSDSAFADDNIALITTDAGTMKTVFIGGPGGVTAGTFFTPSIPTADLENPQTGLRLDGDNVNFYTAVLNDEMTDVFDNPNDGSPPTIPDAPVYQIFQVTEIHLPGPNVADIVGRVRVQDNNSTMPTNRIFLDYNYFHNVPFTANGIDVNRFTPGVEKTFLDGMGSVEMRVPMAVTFSSDQSLALGPDASEPEFGNVTIIPKILLTSNGVMAVAAGMAVALPTADNYDVFGAAGPRILSIENESVHVIPFLSFLYTPEQSDCFAQAFVTIDVDTNGNPVNADLGTGSLESVGIWNDQTLASASGTFGKYLYQNYSRHSRIKSFSLVSELHYTATASDADTINSGPFLLGNADHDVSVLNATFGGHLRLKDSTLTTGYTVPLTSSDRIFDGEFRLFINQFF
jgi:hypothetical protein